MYINTQKPLTIDFVDFLWFILKKIWIVMLAGVIVSCAIFGEKYISSYKNYEISSQNDVLDITVKLPGETDAQYSDRILNVNRAKDLINCIDAYNLQIDKQRTFVSDSVFMQINSEEEALTTANLVVEVDGNAKNGSTIALLSSYKQYILSGEYLTELSEELGINQGYLTELISVDYDSSYVVVSTSMDSDNIGVLTISVIGPDIELTDRIMDSIIDGTNAICKGFNDSIVKHSISYSISNNSYIVDSSTRDKQINVINRFESLQLQVINYGKSLDDVAAKLGVSKDILYSYYSYNNLNSTKATFSLRALIKYAVIGFLIGALIVVLILFIKYTFSSKFSNQAIFFSRFNWVKKIAVDKPTNKRSKYSKLIDQNSGDDNRYTVEQNIGLISANTKNLSAGMNRVMITGTANFVNISRLVKAIGIKADVKASFFEDPASLELLSNYDGVIIVEQRNYSDCRLVDEEIKLIDNSGVKLIGAIII